MAAKVQERLASLGIHSLEGAVVLHQALVLIAHDEDGNPIVEVLHPAKLSDEALARELPYQHAPSIFNEEGESTPFREKYTKRTAGDFF